MPRHQFYNTRDWLKLRASMLRREPVCRACHQAPATDVDHITPIRAGGSMTHPSNLQCLCHGCHSRKTLGERLGKRVRVKGCNPDGTPRDLHTHRRRRRASRRQVEAAIEVYRPIRAGGQGVNIRADHKPKC